MTHSPIFNNELSHTWKATETFAGSRFIDLPQFTVSIIGTDKFCKKLPGTINYRKQCKADAIKTTSELVDTRKIELMIFYTLNL